MKEAVLFEKSVKERDILLEDPQVQTIVRQLGGSSIQAKNMLLSFLLQEDESDKQNYGLPSEDAGLLDEMITFCDRLASSQINEILHDPDFQKLESAWRGLEQIV